MNKFNTLPEAEEERISICCSALLNDFNICLDCKEASSPVSEEDIKELISTIPEAKSPKYIRVIDENEVRAMQEEEVERKLSEQKY